MLVNVYFWADL